MTDSLDKYHDLIERLNLYRRAYFEENTSIISDEKYDQLYRKLLNIEANHPDWVSADSPTRKIGYSINDRDKAKHPHPMYGLDNVFNRTELMAFMNRCLKKTNTSTYYLDSKIDGLALDLVYRGGALVAAITRGDGEFGEDVLANAVTIPNIPKNINTAGTISIRGEVSAHRETFNFINDKLEKEGKPIFSHIRNYAAGSLRQKDPEITRSRQLKFYAWECLSNPVLDRDKQMAILVKLGFNIPEGKLCTGIDEIEDYISQQGIRKTDFSYPIDGVVIKVNDMNLAKKIGCNARAPLWAVAWKFTDHGSHTTIRDIHWQVGRTGKLTPVATLDPVTIDGATITEVTLHNADYVIRNSIGINTEVTIVRRGDVIPKIEEVVSTGDDVIIPKTCPVCSEKLQLSSGPTSKELRCINKSCKGMFKAFLRHLTSKEVFNIKGIGPSVISDFMDNGVTQFIDIFQPIVAKSYNQQILADKLTTRARKITLMELFMVLGIPGMGKAIASKISTETRNLKGLSDIMDDPIRRNQLRLSPSVKTNLINWWSVPHNREFIDSLRELNLPRL